MGEDEFLGFVEGRMQDIENELIRQGFLLTNTKTILISMIDRLMQEVREADEY